MTSPGIGRKMKNKTSILLLSLFLVLIVTTLCFANVPEEGALDQIKNVFRDNSVTWGPTLQLYAERIFWGLAAIDLTLAAVWLVLNPGEFSDFTALVVRKTLVIGFFFALLQNGIAWANLIVKSLVVAGGTVNTGAINITPSDIFETGYNLCSDIIDATGVFSPIDSLGLVIGGFIVMICFALIAAMMLLVYVQAFIMVNAGILFLGFGGLTYTREIALVYFRAALSVGAKLFIMILVVGLGQTILSQWIAVFDVNFKELSIFIGAAVVLLALVKAIPDMVGDLINGFSWGAGESLGRTTVNIAKTSVAASVGAGAAAAGGTMAVHEAVKLAKASGSSGFGLPFATTGKLIKSGFNDVAGRLSGKHWGHGTAGGRMAANMQQKRQMTPGDAANQGKKEEESEPYFSPLNEKK